MTAPKWNWRATFTLTALTNAMPPFHLLQLPPDMLCLLLCMLSENNETTNE